jgi:hypothetical protein
MWRPCGAALDAVPNLMVEYINKGFLLYTAVKYHLRNRHPTTLFTMDTTLYSHNDNNNIRTITMTMTTITITTITMTTITISNNNHDIQ